MELRSSGMPIPARSETKCACGSGLRPVRCCHLAFEELPASDAGRHLLPLVDKAIAAHTHGDPREAERLCLEILELAPNQGGALAVLYRIRHAEGALSAAEALCRRLVSFQPNTIWATQELALLLFRKGDYADAEHHARNAIRIAPTDPQSHNLMGMIMTEQNRPQVGEYHYRQVLALSGRRDPILLANLAWNLRNQGKIDAARALYQESVRLAPDILQTLIGYARMEETDRNFTRAEEILDQAERLDGGNSALLLERAVLRGRVKDYDGALAILDSLGEGPGLGSNELLEKGRLLDKLGRHDEAFAAFAEGKRMARLSSGTVYRADLAADLVTRLEGYFTAERLKIVPRANVARQGPQPIFIVGFPRSGTTMVEQSLSAHPKISAGDELPFLSDITGLMPRMLNSPLAYPEALADLWMGDQRDGLDVLRDFYLQKARQQGFMEPGANWFTDKMPLNETHLGLIGLIFPETPVIHVLRHPLDVVLSVFSNHLTHGFYCANDLETIARHYMLVFNLVAHYRHEMTLKYLPIRYEDIVTDQKASIQRLLAFIGLPFDNRCLKFHENRRYARTASYAQVTEKLYASSCYRYRHYLKHLAPVLPILEPAILSLGYTIDG